MSLMKFKKDSSFQRIKASYLDETSVELTAKELEKKKRMSHAWGLRLNNKYSAHQTIQILMREYSISQATAYREYNMAMQIFGDLDETSIAAERLILKEALWNAYQKAVKQGNVELEGQWQRSRKYIQRTGKSSQRSGKRTQKTLSWHRRI